MQLQLLHDSDLVKNKISVTVILLVPSFQENIAAQPLLQHSTQDYMAAANNQLVSGIIQSPKVRSGGITMGTSNSHPLP